MKQYYQIKGNVHIPALKTTFQKGTRLLVEDNILKWCGQSVEVPYEFKILVKAGYIAELSEEEAATPEVIEPRQTVEKKGFSRLPVVERDEIDVIPIKKSEKPSEMNDKSHDDKTMRLKTTSEPKTALEEVASMEAVSEVSMKNDATKLERLKTAKEAAKAKKAERLAKTAGIASVEETKSNSKEKVE